jgi:tetraacyldisaccharide 4'-kinase
MKLLRKIFFPLVPIFYLISSVRNKLFDLNLLKSKAYNIPIICVGNLSVGGTGKTPMIEYLVRLMSKDNFLAILSRGYKRDTSGFILANDNTTVEEIGDEPYQYKHKFKNVVIAVDANRQNGIETLLGLNDSPDIILLDDGFQHRKVKAGLYILLTSFNKLFTEDYLLPYGDLRESKRGAKRADVLIVTKCPKDLKEETKAEIAKKIKLNSNQKLFFSGISYDDTIYSEKESTSINILNGSKFSLVTGIANSNPLVEYLESIGLSFEHLNYKDHYNFTEKDLDKLNRKKLILTTEKDFMRLKGKLDASKLFYLPIKTEIYNEDDFKALVQQFVLKF